MKFAKLSIVALSLGLFIASCGNNDTTESTETPTTDTAVMAPATETPAPATMDTTKMAAPMGATADTMNNMK